MPSIQRVAMADLSNAPLTHDDGVTLKNGVGEDAGDDAANVVNGLIGHGCAPIRDTGSEMQDAGCRMLGNTDFRLHPTFGIRHAASDIQHPVPLHDRMKVPRDNEEPAAGDADPGSRTGTVAGAGENTDVGIA